VANVVFVPTALAYGWSFLGYVYAGVSLYLIFMFLAYKMELFEHLREWPRISRVALYCGPILLVLGCYFSAKQTSYLMLIPTAIYAALSILGGLALVGKFNAS
jgi:hypothetical protein